MNLKKYLLILILIPLFTISNKSVSSDVKDEYTIISDYQKHNEEGIFEANGNVKITGQRNFSASSDFLIYEKNKSRLNLKGNVEIKNYEFDGILIKNILGDELILFLDNNGIVINSKKGSRVKTKLEL